MVFLDFEGKIIRILNIILCLSEIIIGCYVKKFFRIILLLEINLYVWSKMFNGIKKERDFIYKKIW